MPSSPFLSKPKSLNIPVVCVSEDACEEWLNDRRPMVQRRLAESEFTGKAGQFVVIYKDNGSVEKVIAGMSSPVKLYDVSAVAGFVQTEFSKGVLSKASFTLAGFAETDLETAYLGWALGCYRYEAYQSFDKTVPKLVWGQGVDKARVKAFYTAIAGLRDLINAPANDMGPAEIEEAAAQLGKVKSVKGKKLESEFPLVHMVGKAAIKGREPRLIELSWGKKSDPKVTIVGKGVCFDTGGLDLKPTQYMRLMKKDMGGAAHAIGLARMIIALKLPVHLTLLVPAVENAIGAGAFRPGDVVKSRNGTTVENENTDAEGRLILADALTYAVESKPDLVIDFATLTGSARAALGQDIPACFTNDPALEPLLREISFAEEDPLWPMPLHQDYMSLLKSDVADRANQAKGTPGDLIYSALFLESFLGDDAPSWIHVDCFAWESIGRPGRAKGGKDTGLRALFAVVESLYG